jgi:hypothetical protein
MQEGILFDIHDTHRKVSQVIRFLRFKLRVYMRRTEVARMVPMKEWNGAQITSWNNPFPTVRLQYDILCNGGDKKDSL